MPIAQTAKTIKTQTIRLKVIIRNHYRHRIIDCPGARTFAVRTAQTLGGLGIGFDLRRIP